MKNVNYGIFNYGIGDHSERLIELISDRIAAQSHNIVSSYSSSNQMKYAELESEFNFNEKGVQIGDAIIVRLASGVIKSIIIASDILSVDLDLLDNLDVLIVGPETKIAAYLLGCEINQSTMLFGEIATILTIIKPQEIEQASTLKSL